jgi:PleD family two-component response regulator
MSSGFLQQRPSAAKSNADRRLALIVDDTPSNVELVAGALKDSFRIEVATDGQKALGIAGGSDKPDIILLDATMPDMDGFEVCRRLKSDIDTRDIPIIFIAGTSDALDEAKAFEIGAADCLYKPFSAPVVLARVKTQLALHAALALKGRTQHHLQRHLPRLCLHAVGRGADRGAS